MKQTIFKERVPGLMIEHITRDDEFNMAVRHMHSEYEIYYLLEGERYYFIESETIHIKPGTLLFIDREKIHKTSSVSGKPYYNRMLIELKPEWLETFFHSLRAITIGQFFSNYRMIVLDDEKQELVKSVMLTIAREAKERRIGYEQMIRSKLAELLLCVIRSEQRMPSADMEQKILSAKCSKVNEVAEYIQENCQEEISLQGLSERFFVSKCYLSRIFKEVTGFTVNEYLMVQRIKKGRTLLETTEYSITQVSEMAGFESVSYFEKVFKKQMGQTPLKYRKIRLAAPEAV